METQGFTNECVVQLQQLVQTLPDIAIRTRHRQVELQVRRIVFTELSAQWAQCDESARASTPAQRSTVSRWQSMTAGIRSCMSQHPRLLDELSSAGALGCALENKCLRLAVQQLHQIKREEQLCVRAVGTVADRQSAIAACHRCAASAASLLQCVREGCLHAAGDADDEQEDTASQADSDVDTTDGNANTVGGRSTDDVPVPQLDVDEKSRISRSESDTLKLALRAAQIPEALRTKATRLVDRLSGPRRATTAAASKIEKQHSRLKIRTADSAKFKQHVQRIRQMPVTDNGLLGCVTRHKAKKHIKLPRRGAELFERYDITSPRIQCNDKKRRHIVHVIRYRRGRVPNTNTRRRLWKAGMAILPTIQDIEQRRVHQNPPALMYPQVYVQVWEPGTIPAGANKALNQYNACYPYLEPCGLEQNMHGAIVFATDKQVSSANVVCSHTSADISRNLPARATRAGVKIVSACPRTLFS